MKQLSERHKLICQMPYHLIHFLIENNCLSKFVYNTLNYSWKYLSFSQKIENTFDSCPCILIFDTDITPEGLEYWLKIDSKYEKYYYNNLKIKIEKKLILSK